MQGAVIVQREIFEAQNILAFFDKFCENCKSSKSLRLEICGIIINGIYGRYRYVYTHLLHLCVYSECMHGYCRHITMFMVHVTLCLF